MQPKTTSCRVAGTLLAIVGVIVLAASAQAQDALVDASGVIATGRLQLGVTGAFTRNFHTGGFTSGDTCDCPFFTDGVGTGFRAGIAARYSLTNILSLDARVTYDSRPGSFETSLPEALVLLPGSTDIVEQIVVAKADIEYRMISIEALLALRLLKVADNVTVTVSAGPAIGFVQEGRMTKYQDLLSPEKARFTNPKGYETENDGRRIYFMRDADIPELNATRFAVIGGMSVDIGLGDFMLRPGFYYDHGLTSVTDAENWNLSSLIVQLDLLYAM